VSEYFGARWGLVLGASACLLAAAFGALVLRKIARRDADGIAALDAQVEQPTLLAEPVVG
jgi:hypothetical protein